MSYPATERAKARNAYRQLTELAMQTKTAAERGLVLPEGTLKIVAALSQGATDPFVQAKALGAIAEDIRTRHLNSLLPLAKDEFAAFCEYVNPDEPPESKWHIFLTDQLQQIEVNPSLNRFILNCPPGVAKPLSCNTKLLMADGTWKRLGDVTVGDRVVSDTGASRRVTEVHTQGVLPLLKITTTGGRVIYSAYDHSFRVGDAWRRADELRSGDKLDLVMRPARTISNRTGTPDEFLFAAYVASQGAMSWMASRNKQNYYRAFRLFASLLPDAERMAECLDRLGLKYSLKPRVGGWNILISMPDADALADRFRLDDRKDNLRVPSFVMNAGDEHLIDYLSNVLFSCGADLSQKYHFNWLTYYSHSLGFLYDLQKLLGRFGVGAINRILA
jgi:hypothetical protein